MSGFSNFLIDAIEDGRKNARNAIYFEGFDEAANVCMETIDIKIEKLFIKIKDGKSLSAQEQFLLAQLNELKKEIDGNLIKYLENR